MSENNNLIICPTCAKMGKKQILGRLLDNGQFIVLRFHHGTTIIQAISYVIKCGCGFQVAVNSGQVSISQFQQPMAL